MKIGMLIEGEAKPFASFVSEAAPLVDDLISHNGNAYLVTKRYFETKHSSILPDSYSSEFGVIVRKMGA